MRWSIVSSAEWHNLQRGDIGSLKILRLVTFVVIACSWDAKHNPQLQWTALMTSAIPTAIYYQNE